MMHIKAPDVNQTLSGVASNESYRLYEDGSGVRHWRYRFAGLLLVCGHGRGSGRDVHDEDAYPTCLGCIVVMMREEGR